MKKKNNRIRKKGRIKKIISEWDSFWEEHPGYILPPSSWKDSRVELLHIAIALQDHEPEEILSDLHKLKSKLEEIGIHWRGNLSLLFKVIIENQIILNDIKNSVFNKAIKFLMITYHKLFGFNVPKGNLLAHKYVYRAYKDNEY